LFLRFYGALRTVVVIIAIRGYVWLMRVYNLVKRICIYLYLKLRRIWYGKSFQIQRGDGDFIPQTKSAREHNEIYDTFYSTRVETTSCSLDRGKVEMFYRNVRGARITYCSRSYAYGGGHRHNNILSYNR